MNKIVPYTKGEKFGNEAGINQEPTSDKFNTDANTEMPYCKNLGKAYNLSKFLEIVPNHEEKYTVTQSLVTTEDGYNLRLFRITLNRNYMQKLPENDKQNIDRPVLFIHGSNGSCEAFLYGDEKHSIPIYFVNRGFDVWLANYRCNKYSLSHTNTNISVKDFYDHT